jgi:methylated-DNA-[protein]-cysteine S-methyltransferase
MNVRHALSESSLGPLTLVANDDALSGVYFPHHWHKPTADALGEDVGLEHDALLAEAAGQLNEYLTGKRDNFTLPTVTTGDEFQETVWALLRQIPYGSTTTYGDLAEHLGDKKLAQQVGRAVGDNPLSIVIPCHRVVGKDGKLVGYAGGLSRKLSLLDLEEPAADKATKLF